MLEAKSAGYSISQNLLNTWKTWEVEQAKKAYSNNFRNQAYRLYLLAVAGDAQMGAMNLMKENNLEKLDWLSKYLLAGAYYAAGKETIAKQVFFAELQTKGLPLEDNIKTESKGVAIQRYFINQSGERISTSQIKQGEVFWLVLGVKSLAASRIENLALSNILPSGFEISNGRLNDYNMPGWLNSMRPSVPDYVDIRDDRINWFFNLGPNETKVFAAQIHPSYAGEFRWPGVVLEAMYSPDYFARIAGERISVGD